MVIYVHQRNPHPSVWFAFQNGHESAMQLLEENGANVNLFEENSQRPLYSVCFKEQDNIVIFFIEKGA